MTSFRFLHILLFLLFHQVYSEEPEPVFRAEGNIIEMGYCFGVDYIVVYRDTPQGSQLLGNSSVDSPPITPPADLHGRIQVRKTEQLLGLQISDLTHLDSGIYRRQCWQERVLTNQQMHQLIVCQEEIESTEITVRQADGGAEVLCNSTSIGVEGTYVHWYYETHPYYRPTLFLDSSVSVKPLLEDLQSAVEVRDNGRLLLLNHSMLNNHQQFYCLVIKGQKCLSFQNMYLPDTSDSRDVFVSRGERVVLPCTSSDKSLEWETPLGMINSSSVRGNDMFISSDKNTDYSLVISAVDDDYQGEYSCFSPSDEIQYSVIICPKKDPQYKFGYEAGEVSLECDVGSEKSVQWYRKRTLDRYELFYDSNDQTVATPEDLRGRLMLSQNRSRLTISDLDMKDMGAYYCVVLREITLSETDDEEYEYDDEDSEDYENNDEAYWEEDQRCVFKQETILNLINDTKPEPSATARPNITRDGRRVPVPVTPEPDPTTGPDSDATGYALGIGLGLLCLVAVVAAVIAIRRRRKTPPQQSQTNAQSGVNTSNDITMNVETDSLAQNDEFNA